MTFDPTSSYTLEDLKPDTLYHFQLAARSDMGVGVFTPTIEARTAQSSKCLLRPHLSHLGWDTTHGHTPFPFKQMGGQYGLLLSPVLDSSLDHKKGTGKWPAGLCPGSGCLLCSLPSLLVLFTPVTFIPHTGKLYVTVTHLYPLALSFRM